MAVGRALSPSLSGLVVLLELGEDSLVLQLGTKEGEYSIMEPQFPRVPCMGLCCGTRPEHMIGGRRISLAGLGFHLGLCFSYQALSRRAP